MITDRELASFWATIETSLKRGEDITEGILVQNYSAQSTANIDTLIRICREELRDCTSFHVRQAPMLIDGRWTWRIRWIK